MMGSDSFLQAGWVHDMRLFVYQTDAGTRRYAVLGKVKHSQRMSATPLLPWFVAEKCGEILAAHCTCMAGLGEACSHIAALVLSVIKANQLRKIPGEDACTSKTCAWLPPNRNVVAAQVENIKFSKPSTCPKKTCPPVKAVIVAPPTAEELAVFHASLASLTPRPVIHHVMDDYAHEFRPNEKFPEPLSALYEPDSLGLTYPELLVKCADIADSLKVTSAQCEAVEMATRDQAANKRWFSQQAGRITASNFKSAARTNQAMPSVSLVKRICYPEAFHFSTEATRWGCEHEKIALEAYLKQESPHHETLRTRDCGLLISSKYPFVGASPDALLVCNCCGQRALEIKCPYCVRDGLPIAGEMDRRDFCMTLDPPCSLKKDHAYYYQVQAQLNVRGLEEGVFVLWTKKEIVTEHIQRDFLSHPARFSFKNSLTWCGTSS
ncbi:uncharacterized protein [Diadema setosum]|uniref:uncharacterized protein isoform X1 n=1 Tax=Diadema setosum TaxID=31175 RepID=UPI003B3ADBE8